MTLRDILSDTTRELQSTQQVINLMIRDAEEQGIEMPELDDEDDDEPRRIICGRCDGNGCWHCNNTGEIYY